MSDDGSEAVRRPAGRGAADAASRSGRMRGRFVTLEGIEGVGKSTNVAFVADCLRRAGIEVVATREPGGVPVAERIRDVLLATDGGALPPVAELLLMFAARAAHLEQLVWPTLEQGKWVVCDRFTDASYAYQGGGRGLPAASIASLESLVHHGFAPDFTLLLDAGWAATRERREQRAVEDRFEREGREFFERVRGVYLERAGAEPERFRVVDAARPVAEVQRDIAAIIASLIVAGARHA
jgi:dTMP kinase